MNEIVNRSMAIAYKRVARKLIIDDDVTIGEVDYAQVVNYIYDSQLDYKMADIVAEISGLLKGVCDATAAVGLLQMDIANDECKLKHLIEEANNAGTAV